MKSVLLLLTAFVALSASAQRKSPHDTVSNGKVTVTYGRPYKKDRDIFGGLEKYGKVWRVGADEATTITFSNDVKFAGKEVKAGTYTLFAIPNEKEWTIILNAQGGQWGAYDYDKNKDKDVAQVKVPVKKLDKTVEQLTISFAADNTMNIAWDKTQVAVPLHF
ncbi:MAG TPA: DUF2911 domain-containing protein [Chitinophagaceae bacterium]